MGVRRVLTVAVAAASLGLPGTAAADYAHTVMPGETLSSVAAADGLTISELAAANGLAVNAQLITGSTLLIPPQTAGATGTSTATSGTGTGSGDEPAGDDTGGETSGGAGGAYVVQPGDTLSAIAVRAGSTVADIAAANGIDPNAPLLIGTVLTMSGSSAGATVVSAPSSVQPVGQNAPPYPTPEHVTSSEVGSIAADNGVPASLAAAIGWQESGFNNALVSGADARGVMQIVPGTWAWIQDHLAGGSLAPASALANVRGGVLLLRSLLNATGGDPALTAAGYYQGLQSVRSQGMYSDTQRYVANVLSLRQRFGGP